MSAKTSHSPAHSSPWHRRLALTHRALGYYVLAVMVVAHAYFFMELISPANPPIALHVHSITWIVPGIMALAALLLEHSIPRQGQPSRLDKPFREMAPLLVGSAVFALWAGGYFLVGALGALLGHHSLHTALDDKIPYVPQAVFIYLTVYPAAMLPFLWETKLERAFRTAGAYLTVLGISFAVMLLYPVALPHPPARGPILTRFALGLLHSADPAWNCFPSSHCAVILTAALALWEQGKIKGTYGVLVALAIGASTLLTKQHYITDALAGFALAFIVHWAFFRTTAARRLGRVAEKRTLTKMQRWTGGATPDQSLAERRK